MDKILRPLLVIMMTLGISLSMLTVANAAVATPDSEIENRLQSPSSNNINRDIRQWLNEFGCEEVSWEWNSERPVPYGGRYIGGSRHILLHPTYSPRQIRGLVAHECAHDYQYHQIPNYRSMDMRDDMNFIYGSTSNAPGHEQAADCIAYVLSGVVNAGGYTSNCTSGPRLEVAQCMVDRQKPVESGFRDVLCNHQFRSQITWATSNHIVTGWQDGTFRPREPVQRQAVAAMLYRCVGDGSTAVQNDFTDVPTTHQFARQITWAADENLVRGWQDGTFRPTQSVQRQAVAAMLYRMAGRPPVSIPSGGPFQDVPANHQFAREITWASNRGIVSGWQDGTFRPSEAIQRQAVVAMLNRYDSRIGC